MSSLVSDEKSCAQSLWLDNDLPAEALLSLELSENPDPSVNSSFKLGTAAQVRV